MNKKNEYDSLGYYAILKATPDMADDVIRQNYREMAKFWHPDHNKEPNAVDMFQKISVAYDVLKETKSRLKYTLLSLIYNEKDFPNMGALCILRNMHGQEDLNMRAFRLVEVTGKGIKHNKIDKMYCCSQYEAAGVIGSITRHNWMYGFWGIGAFFVNIAAIIQNISRINGKAENLTLLIHNALAYETEGKKEEAYTLATLAKLYIDKKNEKYLNAYLETLGNYSALSVKKWNFSKLKQIQLFYPAILLFVGLSVSGVFYLKNTHDKSLESANVKQVVIFQNGQKTYSDVAVAKIFDIPVDITDKERLYHVNQPTPARHGADKEFDVYKTIELGTTVRITGYTVDKKWYRVMFDSGEMAFIETDMLTKGIGNEIPLWSKIYKEE